MGFTVSCYWRIFQKVHGKEEFKDSLLEGDKKIEIHANRAYSIENTYCAKTVEGFKEFAVKETSVFKLLNNFFGGERLMIRD